MKCRYVFHSTSAWLLVLVLTAPATFAQNAKEKIVASDLTRIKQIGSVQASPDGKQILYSVTTIEPGKEKFEYDYRTHLYLTEPASGAASQALTRGEKSVSQAQWSPDGKSIVFVRSVDDKSQLFVLPLGGGEPYQLTKSKYGAGNPQWSPDGKKILFSVSVSLSELMTDSLLNPNKSVPAWSLEKPGTTNKEVRQVTTSSVKPNPDGSLAEIRKYLSQNVTDKKAKVINRLNFQGEATTQPDLNIAHVFVIDATEGATPKPLTHGFTSVVDASWIPDGKGILFVTDLDSTQHPDRARESAIARMDANGGNKKMLLSEKGKRFDNPVLAPDGKTLAFISSQSEGLSPARLGMVDISSGTNTATYVDFDRNASDLTWTSDSRTLYFTAPSNGGFPLYRMAVKDKKVAQLTDYDSGVASFDIAGSKGDKIVFAKNEVANPSELYVSNASLKNAQPITALHEWVKSKALSVPEKHTLKNTQGQTVEYWIMKPTNFQAGKTYPLLLQIHGGPSAMWGPGEASMWHEFQFFASAGYGIVYANPRGSGGYGFDFYRAIYQDWGTGPMEDILAAATEAANASWVDTSRQVVTGGSYAGYMVAWIIGHDHRFKAAVAQRGVYEMTTFMGEGNAWRLVPNYFGGYPWEDKIQDVLDKNSPYTYVDQIRTPFLIKHGENDLRTGVIQSEMLYKSLKILGKDVEYVRMPGATHELSRSGNVRQRVDRILRIYEFMERYIGEGESSQRSAGE